MGPMAGIFGDSLSDPRADIREADVVDVIKSSQSTFDAILLDVDNGPEALIRKANDALYDRAGLQAIRRALRPGGVLAVWSSGSNPGIFEAARCRRFRGQRSRRSRHHQTQRRASRHLVRDQIRRVS